MKRFSVVILGLLFGITSYGQGLDLGLKIGANFSTISDASSYSNKTGFHAGAFAAIKFSDKLAIQGDLLYSQQGGAKLSPEDFDLDYVNVPVVVKYYLVRGLNLQAGPQFGFMVNDNSEEDPEAFDLSGVLGAGYDLPFGLRLDARYNFGLTDVLKEGNSKNQVFSIALGYSFL